MLWIWVTAGIILTPLVLFGLHRFALTLEKAGYLKYLNSKDTGGGGASAMLGEVDKITQPNAQRIVTEAKEENRIVIKKVAGDDLDGETKNRSLD